MISQAVFKMVLPMACAWAEEQEAVILRDGVALTASQIADARHAKNDMASQATEENMARLVSAVVCTSMLVAIGSTKAQGLVP